MKIQPVLVFKVINVIKVFNSLWARIIKNPDVCIGPLTRPFAHTALSFAHTALSLARFAPLASLARFAALTRLLTLLTPELLVK